MAKTTKITPNAAPAAATTTTTSPMDESARSLVNWLSTRVSLDGLGRLQVDPDHELERALIEPRLAKAQAQGLTVTPGAYIPPPGGSKSALSHQVHCLRCDVRYRESHLHCCQCRRVFRTAHSYEVHQRGGPCASDAQLDHHGLYAVDGVWRGKSPEARDQDWDRRSRSIQGGTDARDAKIGPQIQGAV